MAYGTANLMHTIDPDVVLFERNMTFGRDETHLGCRFVDIVREEVKRLSFPVPSSKIRIGYAELGGCRLHWSSRMRVPSLEREALAGRRGFACRRCQSIEQFFCLEIVAGKGIVPESWEANGLRGPPPLSTETSLVLRHRRITPLLRVS